MFCTLKVTGGFAFLSVQILILSVQTLILSVQILILGHRRLRLLVVSRPEPAWHARHLRRQLQGGRPQLTHLSKCVPALTERAARQALRCAGTVGVLENLEIDDAAREQCIVHLR